MKKGILIFIISIGMFYLAGCDLLEGTPDTYTITYETNGGSILNPIEYVEGDLFELPEEPELEGNTFSGWYLDQALTETFSLSDSITRSIFLYAKFEVNIHTVVFLNDHESFSNVSVAYGDIVLPLINPILLGYEFEGYYVDQDLTIPYVFGEMPDHSITIFTKWIELDSTILRIAFVPSRPADEIISGTVALKQLLIDELASLGIVVSEVQIYVGTSYEDVAEGLTAGNYDIAYLPASTYAMFSDDSIEPILSAGRLGLSKDSNLASDWNDGLATTTLSDTYFNYYKGLIIAGTSLDARTLADKVNSGLPLVWDDVKDLSWCVRSDTSSSGYIYPNYWLQQNFGHGFEDMSNVVTTSGFGESIEALAIGTCDVGTFYSDARMHYENNWVSDFGRSESIWTETDVIGVTIPIMNDLIAVNNINLSPEMIELIQTAFIDLIHTPEGLEVFSIYSHQEYTVVTDDMYDELRSVLE